MTPSTSPRVLSLQSSDAQVLLTHARLPQDPKHDFWIPMSVVESGPEAKAVFQTVTPAQDPGFFIKWWSSFRAISLTATIIPGLVLLALPRTTPIDTGLRNDAVWICAAFLAVTLLQIAVNILNDVSDHQRLIDLPDQKGGSGVIQKGWIRPITLQRAAWTFLAIGMGLGVASVLAMGLSPWWIALAAFIGSLGYSNRPFSFKYVALGDLVVFLLCGPLLTLGFSLAIYGEMENWNLLVGSAFGWLAVGILHANNTSDILIDRQRGARTVANVLGFHKSKVYFDMIYFFTMLSIVFYAGLTGTWVSLAVIPVVLVLWLKMRQKLSLASSPDSAAISTLRIEAAQAHLIVGLVWFVLAIIF